MHRAQRCLGPPPIWRDAAAGGHEQQAQQPRQLSEQQTAGQQGGRTAEQQGGRTAEQQGSSRQSSQRTTIRPYVK